MIKLFYEGGPLFMGVLTIVLIIILLIIGQSIRRIHRNQFKTETLTTLGSIGLIAFIVGLLGQLVGLYAGFGMAEQMENMSPAIILGGIKISMITSMYGLIIWLVSRLAILVLGWYHKINFIDTPTE